MVDNLFLNFKTRLLWAQQHPVVQWYIVIGHRYSRRIILPQHRPLSLKLLRMSTSEGVVFIWGNPKQNSIAQSNNDVFFNMFWYCKSDRFKKSKNNYSLRTVGLSEKGEFSSGFFGMFSKISLSWKHHQLCAVTVMWLLNLRHSTTYNCSA